MGRQPAPAALAKGGAAIPPHPTLSRIGNAYGLPRVTVQNDSATLDRQLGRLTGALHGGHARAWTPGFVDIQVGLGRIVASE